MKKLTILIALIIPVCLTNCDKLDELATIDLNTKFDHTVDVSIGVDDPSSIDETFTVSATDDSEIAKYKDVIQNYTVKNITYQIVSYTGETGITFTGTATVEGLSHSIDAIDLGVLYDSGEIVEIDFDQSELDKIAQSLLDGNEISGKVAGEVSGKPVQFQIKFIFDVGFSAKVI